MIKLEVTFYENGNIKKVRIELNTDSLNAVAEFLGIATSAIKSITRI